MILATGAMGMLGGYLATAFNESELVVTSIERLDVRDFNAVMRMVKEVQPRLVLHLAAETDVDLCEREPDHAYRTNVLGTLNVTLACQRFDTEMVYISTVGVFGGDKPDTYTEFDTPSPVSVYAKTKYEGELVVQNLLHRYYTVRAGWMMGGGEKDHKFVGKIVELALQRDRINVVNDTWGNPTYAKDLVANLRLLTDTGLYGLYHMVNTGACTRYEMALEIVRWLGKEVRVDPVSSAHFPLPAPRPRSEAARNYKLDLLGLNHMRPWKDALYDYLGSWIGRA